MANKIVIDASTGQPTIVPETPEEIAEREAADQIKIEQNLRVANATEARRGYEALIKGRAKERERNNDATGALALRVSLLI